MKDSHYIHRWDFDLAHRCAKAYERVIDDVRVAANAAGYAIAVHGSQIRDIDLIAAPWTGNAVSQHELAEIVRRSVDGFIREDKEKPFPRRKPHGRLCWSIHLGGGPYIDLSVLPPIGEIHD